MRIRDSAAFVTGANRGLGLAFAQELLAAGARKVYAAARHPERITLDGVDRVRLDVTKPDRIAAAVSECTDVIPSLPDKAEWDAFETARRAMSGRLSSVVPARRYNIRHPQSAAYQRCTETK